jgi:hypothetical protein
MIDGTRAAQGVAVLVAGVLLAAVAGCSKGYRAQRSVDDLVITLLAERYPLDLGVNALAVQVADRSGRDVPGATVRVRYSLPPMPGMGAVSQDASVALTDGLYRFSADFHTTATWTVEVTVDRAGRASATVRFSL